MPDITPPIAADVPCLESVALHERYPTMRMSPCFISDSTYKNLRVFRNYDNRTKVNVYEQSLIEMIRLLENVAIRSYDYTSRYTQYEMWLCHQVVAMHGHLEVAELIAPNDPFISNLVEVVSHTFGDDFITPHFLRESVDVKNETVKHLAWLMFYMVENRAKRILSAEGFRRYCDHQLSNLNLFELNEAAGRYHLFNGHSLRTWRKNAGMTRVLRSTDFQGDWINHLARDGMKKRMVQIYGDLHNHRSVTTEIRGLINRFNAKLDVGLITLRCRLSS